MRILLTFLFLIFQFNGYGQTVALLLYRGDSLFKAGLYAQYHQMNLQALQLASKNKNCADQMLAKMAVARSYYYLRHKDSSLKLFKKIPASPCINDTTKGKCFRSIGAIFVELGLKDSAKKYLVLANHIFKKHKSNKDLAVTYGILFELEFRGFHQKSIGKLMLDSCKKYTLLSKDTNQYCFYLIKKGIYEMETGIPENAIVTFKEAESLYRKIKSTEGVLYALESIGSAQHFAGEHDASFQTHSQLENYRDTIFREKTADNLAKYNSLFQNKEKEIEIVKLKQKNNLILLVGTFLSLLTIVIAYFSAKAKKAKRLKIRERELKMQQENNFKEILQAQENERARIASDLHDGTGHLLSALQLNISALEAKDEFQENILNKVNEIVHKTASEIRSTSHRLMPQSLESIGLVASIRELINMIPASGGLQINFKYDIDEEIIPQTIKILLYRITQELMNNTLKYAKAKNLHISLKAQHREINLVIEDDGIGFLNTDEEKEGKGIKNIKARLQLYNGKMNIKSDKKSGSRFEINLIA